MGYQVVFEFSPLYELVNSLELFLSKKFIKNTDLGNDWAKEIHDNLDQNGIDLGNPKSLPCFHYLHLLIWQAPDKENIEGFIKWLRSQDPGQLYEKLFSYVSEPLPSDLIFIRDTYVELIKKWNDAYFSKIDDGIMDELRKSTRESAKLKGTSIELVDEVSRGLKIEAYPGLQQVIMTPVFHLSPLVSTRKYKNIAQIFYPIDLPESNDNQPSKKLVRLTKALSDENRLRIIKLLKEGPKTFTEILHHFDISKSTIHHHIMLLRTAGLISAYHTSEFCSESYVYRPSGMGELTKYLNHYIEK